MSKALSAVVSALLLIVITIGILSVVTPWMYELVTTTTNSTGSTTAQQIMCRNAGLELDSNYGYYGVDWNFTGNGTDWLKARIENTGNIDMWGFSFELTLLSSSGDEIMHYGLTNSTEVTASVPLRPSRSAIISANITEDINSSIHTLKAVKVLNSVCDGVAPSLSV
jgi:hypothetical protein